MFINVKVWISEGVDARAMVYYENECRHWDE